MLKNKILASNTVYTCIYHDDKILNQYFECLDEIFKKIKDCENGNNNINDLLETNKIKLGLELSMFKNKSILITGGTGSFGKAFLKEILKKSTILKK